MLIKESFICVSMLVFFRVFLSQIYAQGLLDLHIQPFFIPFQHKLFKIIINKLISKEDIWFHPNYVKNRQKVLD